VNEFVAIDFETAVYNPNSAVSVGLVKYRDYQPVDTYYSLIRPPSLYIRPDFTDIHGLTVDDVKDAPAFESLWDSAILPFIGGLPLAAHNASFDMGVLNAVLLHYGLEPPKISYFCTCHLARRTWPELKSHALTKLARHFDIVYKAHNALDDAMTCGRLVAMSAGKFGQFENLKALLKAAKVRMKKLHQ
jgi:DNA polymerase-3 subunit epsilon